MPIGKGKVLRYHGGLPHFAEVELSVAQGADAVHVVLSCRGAGWERQGYIEEVPATGYDDWKAGAVCGARYALAAIPVHAASVNILLIAGMQTDTNPSIVALATALAVWNAMDVTPPPFAMKRLEDEAFSSWSRDRSYVPTLSDPAH